jgi:oligopeptide/dipeptide ABC transporter ATP-binding protein
MALLEVKNLKKWYPVKGGLFAGKRYVKAVDGVTFELEPGETVGLVGESGCGKSTLGKTIIRLEDPSGGSFKIDNVEVSSLRGEKLRRMRNRFQMIFQDPYGSLNPRMTIHNMLYEVLGLHTKLSKKGRTDRIAELLTMVGLSPEIMHRYPHQFSGGQRQRIGLARALAVNPGLIIADEPVSALDVSVQAQIINLLKEIQEKTGVAYLFIAHDLAVVEHISKRILVMYLGRIVESGESSEICSNPLHPYTKALLSAIPTVERVGKTKRIILPGDMPSPMNPPPGCPFNPRCPVAQEECRKIVPELKPVKGKNHYSACLFPEKVSSM